MNISIKKQTLDNLIVEMKLQYLKELLEQMSIDDKEPDPQAYDITIHLPADHDAVVLDPVENAVNFIEPSESEAHKVTVGTTYVEPMEDESISVEPCDCEEEIPIFEKQEVLTSQDVHTPIAARADTRRQDKLEDALGMGMKERDDNQDIKELHSVEGVISGAMGKSEDDRLTSLISSGIRILKAIHDDNDFIVYGLASSNLLDKQGHVISIDALKRAVPKYMQSGYPLIQLFHSDICVGHVISEYTTEDGITYKTEVDEKGLWVVCKIRKDLEVAQNTIKAILQGELNGFSIAGNANLFHHTCDHKGCYVSIDDLDLYEISICFVPVNDDARFTIIHKGGVQGTCPNCVIA